MCNVYEIFRDVRPCPRRPDPRSTTTGSAVDRFSCLCNPNSQGSEASQTCLSQKLTSAVFSCLPPPPLPPPSLPSETRCQTDLWELRISMFRFLSCHVSNRSILLVLRSLCTLFRFPYFDIPLPWDEDGTLYEGFRRQWRYPQSMNVPIGNEGIVDNEGIHRQWRYP